MFLFPSSGGSVPKFSLSQARTLGFAGLMARVGFIGTTLFLSSQISGCSQSEPQVASDVPAFKPSPAPDATARRPKGMPKNTTAGLQIDPTSGRPVVQ